MTLHAFDLTQVIMAECVGAGTQAGTKMQIRSGKAHAAPGLDAVDHGVIDVLRSNPRATNQEVADKLSITPATVSSRLRRLDEAGVMRVVAVTDFSARGYNVLVAIGVKVRGRKVYDVGRELAALPEVLSLNIMNGPHDIELLVAFHDFEEIKLFLFDHLSPIEGVAALTPGIAADIVKFEFNVAPL
jgi:Lrp/AsnC family transcriptional regulator for asnA, asnC and gidA